MMFELFVVACVGARICEYLDVPMLYPSEPRCVQQAALIAGTVKGRHDPSLELTYEYECRPARLTATKEAEVG